MSLWIFTLNAGVRPYLIVEKRNVVKILQMIAIKKGMTISARYQATPTGTLDIFLSPSPHSDQIELDIECIDLAGGHVTLLGIHMPHDSTVPYNLVSTACNTDAYSYGFNGKLKDNEWAGVGNHYDYGMRQYDSRIARFISVDPLTKKYPLFRMFRRAFGIKYIQPFSERISRLPGPKGPTTAYILPIISSFSSCLPRQKAGSDKNTQNRRNPRPACKLFYIIIENQ